MSKITNTTIKAGALAFVLSAAAGSAIAQDEANYPEHFNPDICIGEIQQWDEGDDVRDVVALSNIIGPVMGVVSFAFNAPLDRVQLSASMSQFPIYPNVFRQHAENFHCDIDQETFEQFIGKTPIEINSEGPMGGEPV